MRFQTKSMIGWSDIGYRLHYINQSPDQEIGLYQSETVYVWTGYFDG